MSSLTYYGRMEERERERETESETERETERDHGEESEEEGTTREEEPTHTRVRDNRAPSPEERRAKGGFFNEWTDETPDPLSHLSQDPRGERDRGYPSGFFRDWTEEQREQWKQRNPLTASFKRAKDSPCMVITEQPSPAVTLPSRLSSVELTPTPEPPSRPMYVIPTPRSEPELDVDMSGGFTQNNVNSLAGMRRC